MITNTPPFFLQVRRENNFMKISLFSMSSTLRYALFLSGHFGNVY